MQVINDISALASYKRAVVTIGSFDGVHRAHQQILEIMTTIAKQIEGKSIVISFQPHPRTVIDPDYPFNVINTIEERNMLLEKAGIDFVLNIPFTKSFASISYVDFIHMLISSIDIHTVVLGYNHNFGKNREGNANLLRQFALENHFQVIEVEKKLIHSMSVSSTLIRKLIKQGAVGEANSLLGYKYEVEIVIKKEIIQNKEYQVVVADLSKIFPQEGIFTVQIGQYFGKICINNNNVILVLEQEIKNIIIEQKYRINFI